MSIPFKPIETRDMPGSAAYLRLVHSTKDELRAAVFVMNCRGEPIEFAYSKADMPGNFLWRPRDLERVAILGLVTTLFEAMTSTPVLLLCLASETPAETLQRDISIAIPSARVATTTTRIILEGGEEAETLGGPDEIELAWYPRRPDDQQPARLLFTRLAEHGLVREPFERMLGAMDEVFQAAGAATV